MTKAIVIGVSAGGIKALIRLLSLLPSDFPFPILIVQHISANSDNIFIEILNQKSFIHVKEAEEKESIEPGTVYIAPADYHVLVEEDFTISLSTDDKENYSRPAIDVLFKSAAFAYHENLIAIVLTGANSDGAIGAAFIKKLGGYVIVQSPEDAEFNEMPKSAIKKCKVDEILTLDEITKRMNEFHQQFYK